MNTLRRTHRIPSVKSIRIALAEHPCPDAERRAALIRGSLELWRDARDHSSFYGSYPLLARCCEYMNGHGVEHIPAGRNAHSPAIDYVNMGDSYDPTVCVLTYRDGRQTVALCPWGVIVERGSYE